MKKYFLLALLAILAMSCKKEVNNHQTELGSIQFTALQSNNAFSGAMEIFPCTQNTTSYVGNYLNYAISPLNPSCIISKGTISNWAHKLMLPLGTYNMIYWGVGNTQSYAASRSNPPSLSIGTDLSSRYWSMALNPDKTTYMPVWDQVTAVQDVEIGSSGLSVNLRRVVAGLNVTIRNSNGSAFDQSITSFEVSVDGIAEKLNVTSAMPENQSKTVKFALTIDQSRNLASNLTAMLYPSTPTPSITITAQLSNGQTRSYTTKLKNAFEANSVQNITILTADILSSDPSGSSFTIDNWNESSQTIDIPILDS